MHLGLDQETWQKLLDRQRARESMALAEGEKQFRAQVAKEAAREEFSRSVVAKKLLQQGIEPLEIAILEWITGAKKLRGVKHVAVRWVERLGTRTRKKADGQGGFERIEHVSLEEGAGIAAFMTLKTVLDGITKLRPYVPVCSSIGDLISDEMRYRLLQERAPGLFEYKLNSFRTSSYAHMARSLDHATRTAVDEDGALLDEKQYRMSPTERINVGAKLVELLVDSTSLVEVVNKKTSNGKGLQRTTLYLEPTPETTEWLVKRTDVLALLQAQNLPMIVPPLQWSGTRHGGFRFALRGKYPLVRAAQSGGKLAGLPDANSQMPLVYDTVNALQNTPWRINTAVYDLVRTIEHRGGGLAGIPHTDILPLPNRPQDIDTNEDSRARWRKAAGQVKDQNHIRKMRGREFQRVLDCAQGVITEDAIFFPYSVDFRGRIYPIADYLHPQGHDLAKALLTFAQGKPIEADGARWLAIHGANCMGETPQGKVSKMTLDERVEWVHSHTKDIIQVADDPFADTWWGLADDPLQFFAFCVEWRNLIRANDRGEEYLCSLPCAMDGTCNGLQHFSAMLHDEVGGAAVNVLPQQIPQDIYERVAQAVLDQLEGMTDDPLALKLLGSGLITRKLAKRPTMTFGYGSKRYGFKMQLKEYLKGLDNWHEIKVLFTTTGENGKEKSQVNAACGLLAQAIWNSLADVVVKAAEGMKWMQECAHGIVKSGKTVSWTVPVTGFQAKQDYCKWKTRQLRTILAGKVIRPHKKEATDQIDPIKQVNAVAPNIVHSLDAAALALTVTQASAEGVEAFAMVHDSYGAMPADCGVLARCCRQSFVRLYTSHDVIDSLHEQFRSQFMNPEECPAPPAKGLLDVNGVLASDYFFS